MSSNATAQTQNPAGAGTNILHQLVHALTILMKAQQGQEPNSKTEEAVNAARLFANVQELVKQGKVDQGTVNQITDFMEKMKKNLPAVQAALVQSTAPSSSAAPATTTAPTTMASPSKTPAAPAVPPAPAVSVAAAISSSVSGLKSSSPIPLTGRAGEDYPISTNLNLIPSTPAQYNDTPGRPTLTGGFASGSGRMLNTASQVAPPPDAASALGLDTARRRKNTPADQTMRRSIQDLVSSIDPNVKIEPDVEDLLLDIADEFIDSVTNFACRLAKHRGGDSLEVRDLQLHLERNHNIRVPGFASDETRISMSQMAVAPVAGAVAGTAAGKKGAQTSQLSLRAQRLAQVAHAKKEAKLM